jgi:hypothetical protein
MNSNQLQAIFAFVMASRSSSFERVLLRADVAAAARG